MVDEVSIFGRFNSVDSVNNLNFFVNLNGKPNFYLLKGAIKENPYTDLQYEISSVGRALAHPVRIKILEMFVKDNYPIRNIDLAKMVFMAPSSIKDHLDKLNDAKLISIRYDKHYYEVNLSENGRYWCNRFGI